MSKAIKTDDERDLFYDRMVSERDWDEVTNPWETERRLRLLFGEVFRGIPLEGVSFLDAGSGGGHFSEQAHLRGAKVTSMDVGETVLEQVRKRCETTRVVGSILEMPFEDGSFDVVFSTEVIEHTPEPLQALREIARVVRPGGLVVVTSPGRLWQPVVRGATTLKLRPYCGRENFIWSSTARKTLEEGGISVDLYRGFNLVPLFYRPLEPLLRLGDRLGETFPRLFVNWVIRGRKVAS
ncbi:MAG: class I SAM-dependent methyltransferase [Myxococcota bacterium]